MSQRFALPRPFEIDLNEDGETCLNTLVSDAFENSKPFIQKILNKHSERVLKNLQNVPDAQEKEPGQWLADQISIILYGYIGYRTGIASFHDEETHAPMTTQVINMPLNKLSQVIGSNLARELFRELCKQSDNAIEKKFGIAI